MPRPPLFAEDALTALDTRLSTLEGIVTDFHEGSTGQSHIYAWDDQSPRQFVGLGYALAEGNYITLARVANTPFVTISVEGGLMNVDYVVDANGRGTDTTLTSAVAAAIAAGGDKTIWICSSPTAEDAIDIGGIGDSDTITICSHSLATVFLTAKSNDDLIKQDSNGGGTDGGLRFRNIGLSIVTADKAAFYVNTATQIKHLTFEQCWFAMGAAGAFTGYLARMTGGTNGLDAMGMRITNCNGTAQGFFDVTGSAAQAPTEYFIAYDNHLDMQQWWDGGGNNAAPSVTDISGGHYTLHAGIEYATGRDTQHFGDLYILFHGAEALFTTGASSTSIDDHSYTSITIQFQNNSGTFGVFGSAGSGNNDGLFIDSVFGIEASGVDVSGGTFLTVDSDYLNIQIGTIAAPDFGTLYSGPSTPMGVPMIVVPTFEVQGDADALSNRMVVIDATGSAWSAVEFQRSGTSRAGFGLWDTGGAAEFGANDMYFAVNDGSWHDMAAFKNDGTVFELNTALNVEGWARIGGDHATSPGNTTDGDLTFIRGFINNDSNFRISVESSNPYFLMDTGDYSEYNRASNYFSWGIGFTEYMRLNATKLDLLNSAYLDANDVQLPLIGSPTYTHVEHLNTVYHSTGWINGGVISDAGGAAINVTAGAGAFRASNSQTAQLRFGDWAASNGLAITANSIRYIGVQDGTPPVVVVRETNNFNLNTDFPLGTIVNESGTLHIQNAPWEIGDHANFMIQRVVGTAPIARDAAVGGLIFSETGTRNVAVSAGVLWRGLTPFTIGALDTNPGGAADTFTTYSADGQKATGVAAWPNTQYDDGDATLQDMDNNRWANLWWFLELDGELVMVYGTNQYTSQARAGEEAMPSTLPNRLQVHGKLAARFIFQKSAGTASEILSAFDTQFSVLGVTDHGNLAGLGDDDHTLYLLADGTRAMTGDIDLDGNNIDNAGVLFLKEQANADADVPGSGQIWVKTGAPNTLYFTDEDGTDVQLGVGGGGSLPAYTVINDNADRAFDADATTLDEIADVLATLISDVATLHP